MREWIVAPAAWPEENLNIPGQPQSNLRLHLLM